MKPYVLLLLLLVVGNLTIEAQSYTLEGELKKWHKVTLTFAGPSTSETATPNPFKDYRLNVTFTNGSSTYTVPGYYAADGNAAESSATSGNKWRVHFAPDQTGTWNFTASFRQGTNVAINDSPTAGQPISFDGTNGSFTVSATDKTGQDHRAKGRLQYVGQHYLQFAETGEYFVKTGTDSPENFLAYEDFDNTPNYGGYRKSWSPHIQDWTNGDPTWKGGKGKGIIGALNYLAAEGQNAFSTLTMNIDGDDRNIYPYLTDTDYKRFDCSKLDQWEIVFAHADKMGLFIHLKTQEKENGNLLDGGELGNDRRLYYRELIARFGHHLALNWNMGEEIINTVAQRKDFAQYFSKHDPYAHLLVLHPFPIDINEITNTLMGNQSDYTGASFQSNWDYVHFLVTNIVINSADRNKKWVVCSDEQGPSSIGVPPDGYTGPGQTQDDIRKAVLWGTLMGGGGGIEYYFGYQFDHSDLTCEDYRTRERMWAYNRHALQFFDSYIDDVTLLSNRDDLVDNSNHTGSTYCLADPGKTYVVFLSEGGSTNLELNNINADFSVRWYDPRNGGNLQIGSTTSVAGGSNVSVGSPPSDPNQDWVVLLTIDPVSCPTAGTSCDDGDASTFNDVEDGDCNCEGTPCPTAGTACNDGNPDTVNDTEDGNCNCSGTIVGGDTDIWVEAECADVGANWSTLTDNNASGDAYLLPPNTSLTTSAPTNAANQVTFSVVVGQSGQYKVFARTRTTSGDDDSFWVRANDGPWQRWNKINALSYGLNYQWEQVGHWTSGDTSTPVVFSLNAGNNTVQFAAREPGARLDKIFVTLNGDMPTGMGYENPNGDCSDCPAAGTACNDGDSSTFDDVADGDCGCAGTPCPTAGTACNDGDPNTINDVEDGNCNCAGTVPNCPDAGTACDDQDPTTFNDVEDGDCGCAGTPCPEIGTACDDGNPATYDDFEDGFCNCNGTPCPTAGTACDDGNPDTVNDTEDGNCNCSGTVVGGGDNTDVWLEAECADVGSNWSILNDPDASGDNYLLPPNTGYTSTPPTDVPNLVTFSFNVSEGGSYKVFARTRTTSGDDDSFWVRANGGAWQRWNKINALSYGLAYQWEQVGNWDRGDTNTPVEFSLNAGSNTVQFAAREPGTRLDKIFVTLNGNVPNGVGYEDPNGDCNISCPTVGTACDDNDPSTFDDVADGNCGCAGTPCPTAGTACDDNDPSTFDDVQDGDCGCAGTPCPTAGTTCDDGDPNTINDVEDGNCGCAGTPPTCPEAGTPCDDNDPSTFDDVEDGDCGCAGTPCPTAGTACDDNDPSTFDDVADGNCGCVGTPCPTAGTACDDGDPSTFDDVQDGDCGCAGTPCPTAGTACDDGDPNTTNDVEDGNCGCAGTPPTCPEAGTPCDDNDPSTFDDVEDGDCGCVGTPCPTAGTACDDNNPSTSDDVEDGNCGCVGTPCPTAGTACDDGDPNTVDDVADGNCGCAGTIPNGGDEVWLEAECAVVGDNWSIRDDNDASNDQYLRPPNRWSNNAPSVNPADLVTFNFNASASGTYRLFARVATHSTNSDSYWVRINGGAWIEWNGINFGNYSSNFQWAQLSDAGNNNQFVTFALNVGANQIEFSNREPNTRLDKVFISADNNFPVGIGIIGGGCNAAPCPVAGTPCDDNDPNTVDDVEDGNCGCAGVMISCPDAGTACDDGDPSTNNDVADGNCGCAGTPCPDAGTACNDNNPATFDDVADGNCGCAGTTCPTAGTACDDGDPNTVNDVEDGNCGCAGTPPACPDAGTPCDDNDPSTFDDVEDGNCGCAGTPCPTAGTACDDGDPNTFNDVEDGNCGCAGTPVVCPDAGTPCDDNDPSTFDDVEDGDCGCAGTPCPTAGTACNDGNPATVNDVADGNCGCNGTACPPVGTACDDGDPGTSNDVQDGNCGCAGTPCPTAGTACDDGDPNTANDVADGNCGCAGEVYDAPTTVWLEAECAEVGNQWSIHSDFTASNEAYILPPSTLSWYSPPNDPEDLVTFSFEVGQSGDYHIFARLRTFNEYSDSYWVRANDGQWKNWDDINADSYRDPFSWAQVSTANDGNFSMPYTFNLNQGVNTIQFSWREPSSRLDKIMVTLNPITPSGLGDSASNCNNGQSAVVDESIPVSQASSESQQQKQLANSWEAEQQVLQVYPNPVRTELTVNWSQAVAQSGLLTLMDVSGRPLLQIRLKSGELQRVLQLQQLPPGMYLLSLQTDDAVPVVERIIVQD